MDSKDILFETSRWIFAPLDVVHFALVSKNALHILQYRVKKARSLLELKRKFRYTPYGFLFERHIEWQFHRDDHGYKYYIRIDEFCNVDTKEIPSYKHTMIDPLYNLRLSIVGWCHECTPTSMTDRITPRPGAWELMRGTILSHSRIMK